MSMSNNKLEIDPVKYEIFTHRLEAIVEEGKEVTRYLSGSTITREAGEVQVAYYDPSGEGVAIACGILMHIMNVTRAIRYMKDQRYEEDIGIYEGDQFINNDAYIAGMHVPDFSIVAPVYYKGELIGYVASISHTPEVGAIEPGGMCPSAKEAYHDGIHVPLIKLIEKGKMRRDLLNMLLRNVRDPRGMELDIRARIAGNERVKTRIKELIDEVGLDFFKAASMKYLEDSENFARKRIQELRPGIYRAQAFTDSFGEELKPAVIMVEMEVTNEGEIVVSTPVVSPQGRCFDNAYLPAVEATVFYTMLVTLLPDGIWNTGLSRVIKLGEIPWKSRLNADPSCSVGYATVGISSVFCNALLDALSRALYSSGKKEEVLAPATIVNDTPIGGINQWGRQFGSILTSGALASGGGGRIGKDGIDSSVNMWNPWTYISDAEGEENLAPIIHVVRKHRPDSGGPGRWRGGVGVEHITMIHGSDIVQVMHFGGGHKIPVNQGMFGGYPGASSYFDWMLGTDVYKKLRQGMFPESAKDVMEILKGEYIPGPPNAPARHLKPGDLWISTSCGGGAGIGDPMERDPIAILRDIENGTATREVAERQYGVVFDASGNIDFEKTEQLRNQIKKDRLERGIFGLEYIKTMVDKRERGDLPKIALDFIKETEEFSPAFKELLEAEKRLVVENNVIETGIKKVSEGKTIMELTPYLNIVEDSKGEIWIACSKCDTIYCEPNENYKYYALVRERDPAEVQPGRLAFDKNWVVYREFYCPGCGTQIEVEAVPPGWPILSNYQFKEFEGSKK